MVNGRAIKSSETIRRERLRRTERLVKRTRPTIKRSQKAIRRGTMNLNRVFDPSSSAERF